MRRVNSEEALISVIIPVFNKAQYLQKCLDSVLAQTYEKIEVVLIDDASSDESGRICDEYAQRDGRIFVIHLEENRGASHARNIGIDRTEGELICFVDADDYVDKELLGCLYENLMETQADVSICGVDYINFGPYADTRAEGSRNRVLNGEEAISCMIKRHFFDCGTWGKLYTRRSIRHCRFHEKIYCGEDLLFLYQLFRTVQKVSCMPDKLYHYVCRKDSITKGGFQKKQYSESLVYEYLCRKLGKKEPELLPLLEQRILVINVRMAVKAVESGEIEGRKLEGYLKKFQKNIRRHMSRKALACFKYKKIAIEVLLLSISTRAFWGILVVYKTLRRYIRSCALS